MRWIDLVKVCVVVAMCVAALVWLAMPGHIQSMFFLVSSFVTGKTLVGLIYVMPAGLSLLTIAILAGDKQKAAREDWDAPVKRLSIAETITALAYGARVMFHTFWNSTREDRLNHRTSE